jgi:hypothetical protein
MAPSHDSRAPSSNASDSRASGSTERSNRRTPSRGSSNVQALNRPNSSTPKPTLYKYTIKNIPEEFATQKKIYNLLTTHLVTRNIHK